MGLKNFVFRNRHKKLTLATWALCAFYRAQMLAIPSRKLEPGWGTKNEESPAEATEDIYWQCACISKVVNHVADRTPWESKCLVRALTARHLLHRKGIPSTLYLGVGKDDNGAMIAHAWIRVGKMYLTGGNGEGYACVGKYCK